MSRKLPLLTLLFLLTALTLTGCKSKEEKAVQALQAARWEGELIDLLPDNFDAWIYVDLAALRQQPKINQLMNLFEAEANEALPTQFFHGNELLLASNPENEAQFLRILRSDKLSEELRQNIRHGKLQDLGENTLADTLQGFQGARAEDGSQWLIAPTQNLLLSGDAQSIGNALKRLSPNALPATAQGNPSVVFASPFKVQQWTWLQPLLFAQDAREHIESVYAVSGGIRLDTALDANFFFKMSEQGNPQVATLLVSLFLKHTLPPMIGAVLHEEIGTWISNHITVQPHKSANAQGIAVRLQIPEQSLQLLLDLLAELANED